MCAQLAKPERAGGGPWRSSFRPAPSPRPAPRARTAARRPPRRRPRGGRPGTRTRLRAPRRPAMGFPVLCHEIAFCGTGPALSPVPRRLPIRPTRQNGPHPPQEPPALHPRWHDDAGVAPPPGSPGRAGPCPTNRVFMAEIQLFDRTPCRSVVGGGPRCPAGAAPPAPACRPASITLPAGRTNHRFRALDPPASRTHIPFECLKRGGGGGFKAPKRGCRHAPTASSGTNNLSYKPQAARRRLTEKKGRARRPAPSAPSPKAPRGAYAGRAPPQIPDLCAGRRNATTRRPREASPRRSR